MLKSLKKYMGSLLVFGVRSRGSFGLRCGSMLVGWGRVGGLRVVSCTMRMGRGRLGLARTIRVSSRVGIGRGRRRIS